MSYGAGGLKPTRRQAPLGGDVADYIWSGKRVENSEEAGGLGSTKQDALYKDKMRASTGCAISRAHLNSEAMDLKSLDHPEGSRLCYSQVLCYGQVATSCL